jgi:hypothetical protein
MVAICRHYADHLENIAIAASGFTADPGDDSDVDSIKSHGRSEDNGEQSERDLTITEEAFGEGEEEIMAEVEQLTYDKTQAHLSPTQALGLWMMLPTVHLQWSS